MATPPTNLTTGRCLEGDCRDVMRRMIAEGVKVQMCVASPPYWGLRDYGVPGQIGLERTPEEFVATMVEVFRLVREVLADDATLWLNMGDSYAVSRPRSVRSNSTHSAPGFRNGKAYNETSQFPAGAFNLKAKDLAGMPWRVAFALQADGWYLRSDIIWHKPNPMPESVTDRPTKAHEYLFLLTKGPRYFYDCDAVREITGNEMSREEYAARTAPGATWKSGGITKYAGAHKHDGGHSHPSGRNRRTVWTIATEAFPGAHFATFPRKLVEPCILAGTSEVGHCPAPVKKLRIKANLTAEQTVRVEAFLKRKRLHAGHCLMYGYLFDLGEVPASLMDCFEAIEAKCGARWVRVVEREIANRVTGGSGLNADRADGGKACNADRTVTTLGWQPGCDCGRKPVPDVVLDPFLGSGTTAEIAQHLGRHWLGIDLNPSYTGMQERRTAQTSLMLAAC